MRPRNLVSGFLVLQYRDLALVHRHVKFSCHFTLIEIQERWFNLLYNKKVSKYVVLVVDAKMVIDFVFFSSCVRSSCQAMRACPPDISSVIQRKVPFSEAEEALLLEIPLVRTNSL